MGRVLSLRNRNGRDKNRMFGLSKSEQGLRATLSQSARGQVPQLFLAGGAGLGRRLRLVPSPDETLGESTVVLKVTRADEDRF